MLNADPDFRNDETKKNVNNNNKIKRRQSLTTIDLLQRNEL